MHGQTLSTADNGAGAFRENGLLEAMPPEVRAAIMAVSEVVQLHAGDTIAEAGNDTTHALFPFDGAMLSLLIDIADGRGVEVATIGREGAYGGIISCGKTPAFSRTRVQNGGRALRISLNDLNALKDRHPFLRSLFCRYSDFLLSQVMQLVACNAFHTIEARAARWLLTARDRVGADRLSTTQEALAEMLGVQRTTVNAVVRELQSEGLVETRRGEIRITDGDALQRRACECYAAINRHFDEVLASFVAD